MEQVGVMAQAEESFHNFCNKLNTLRHAGKRLIETATMSEYIAWHDLTAGIMQEERPTTKELTNVR